jgi:hypothetical protein
MDASHALTLVQPLIEATRDMQRRKVSKSRCDELLLSINALPLGVFEGREGDLERLSLLLWLYGDFQTAREESEKANRKIEQIRRQILEQDLWPMPSAPAPHLASTH